MKSSIVLQFFAVDFISALAGSSDSASLSMRGLSFDKEPRDLFRDRPILIPRNTVPSNKILQKRTGQSPPRSSRSKQPTSPSSSTTPQPGTGNLSPARSPSINIAPSGAVRRLSLEAERRISLDAQRRLSLDTQRGRSSIDRRIESRRQQASSSGSATSILASSLGSSPGSLSSHSPASSPSRQPLRNMDKHTLTQRLRTDEPVEQANKIPSPGSDTGPASIEQTLTAGINRPPTPFTRVRSEPTPDKIIPKLNLEPAKVRAFMSTSRDPATSDPSNGSGSGAKLTMADTRASDSLPPSSRRLAESGRRGSLPSALPSPQEQERVRPVRSTKRPSGDTESQPQSQSQSQPEEQARR